MPITGQSSGRLFRYLNSARNVLPQSHWVTFGVGSQVLGGLEPVLVRRPLRAASGLPQRIGQRGGFLVPKGLDAVFIHGVSMHLPGMLMSLSGVFQGSSGKLLARLMVPFLMRFRGAAVSMGGQVVQLRGSLMVLVM